MVVANGCRTHNADAEDNRDEGENLNSKSDKMSAKAVLICRHNSHAFQERTLNLDLAVKIGRSVARARVASNNAIFDCKVLSRNHALLWYRNGKFYLQDTKSSNGTFVNNQRLSSTGLESTPREVCSGDIVQFGVDVMESNKKVTHGCIVATLKLYLPDGTEAKASRTMSVVNPAGDVSMEDLYKLYHYIQEGNRRERVLQGKLSHLQTLVANTKIATDQSWKALIDEDRLLARIKAVESQLVACSKNLTDDKIRSELMRLEEEKAQYQTAAKEALHKVHQEKLEVTQKLSQLESRLNETEEECQSLHDVSKHAQLELQELAAKYTEAQKNLQFMESKLAAKEENSWEIVKWAMQEKKDLLKKVDESSGGGGGNGGGERCLQTRLRNCWIDDPLNIPKHITAMRNYLQTLVDMNPKLITDVDSSIVKDAINPIEAINAILNKLDFMLAEMRNDFDPVNDTNLTNIDNEHNDGNSNDNQEIMKNDDDRRPYDKNELDDLPNNRDNTGAYIVKPSVCVGGLTTTPRRHEQQSRNHRSSSRRTLVNGDSGNIDDDAPESEGHSESNDDTSSIASDDTIGFNDDNEKSVIEIKRTSNSDVHEDNSTAEQQQQQQEQQQEQINREIDQQQQKHEVRFASGANGKDLEEVHYDRAYRPEEEFADVVATATNDDDSSDSIESPNESVTSVSQERPDDNENNDVIDKPENLEHDDNDGDAGGTNTSDENLDGEYIKTLKAIGNNANHNYSETREYALRVLISSLDSLRGADDDHQAQKIVKRELDELRDWLTNEQSDNIVVKLEELYYRAKNENQRIQEVNEELVILKEKYSVISDEKTQLLNNYKSLESRSGSYFNSSYSVPIQYFAPFAFIVLWIFIERFF